MGGGGPNVFGNDGFLGTGVNSDLVGVVSPGTWLVAQGADAATGENPLAPPEIPQGDAEGLLAQIAASLFNQTQGTRTGLTQNFEDALSGNYRFPQHLNPARDALERQFSFARDNTIASAPAGGALTSALSDLEGQRASGVSQLMGNDLQNTLAQAFQASFGSAPNQSLSGLSSASASEAQRAMASAQAQAAKGQGLGQLGGKLGAAAIMA